MTTGKSLNQRFRNRLIQRKYSKRTRRHVLQLSILAFAVTTALPTHSHAQSLLYDNTDHLWSRSVGARNIHWVGPERINWIDAQPFRLGGHDNIASVSIPMSRSLDATSTGTIRFTIWDDNGGVPGQEVGELGVLDIESLPRFNHASDFLPPRPPNPLPLVTFDAPIEDLVPDETHYVVIDYGGLDSVSFGEVLVGLGNDTAGTNRGGTALITFGDKALPPLEHSDWELGSLSSHRFLQMSITTASEPYTTIACPVGTIYHQDFTLGNDGLATTFMPSGWAFSDSARSKDFDLRDLTDEEQLMRTDTRIFDTSITEDFPVARSLGQGTSIYNAGVPGDADRALAIGVPRTSEDAMLQLVTEVAGGDANSIQLAFDIEAWDSASSRDNPGEAAFNVALDLDTGNGFQQIMDLGKVTTGATLVPPTSEEEFVNGNDPAYRTSFNSGLLNLDLPEGSLLRVRWQADLEAETRGWVFGLDNVALGMFEAILGDFNNDGELSPTDMDLLSAAVRDGNMDLSFDVDGNGQVNEADRQFWIGDASIGNNTFLGDSNLDRTVDFSDFLSLSAGFGESGGWADGDFDGNGQVEFPDFLLLSTNFGQTSVAAASVPEPSSAVLLLFGLLSASRRRQFCV